MAKKNLKQHLIYKNLSAKEVAEEISNLIKLIDLETAPCGSNPIFYNEISKELKKIPHYNIEKLFNIVQTTIVLKRLR